MDILKSLGHPEEIFNLFKFKMGGCRAVMPKLDYVSKIRSASSVLRQTLHYEEAGYIMGIMQHVMFCFSEQLQKNMQIIIK